MFIRCGYSIVLMVSRLINSLENMCVLLFFSQSAIGRAWEEQYLGLVLPPISGIPTSSSNNLYWQFSMLRLFTPTNPRASVGGTGDECGTSCESLFELRRLSTVFVLWQ